ncbi:hypothetical protein IE53DRAFT_233752 [Violaceomyces palustris]|uniref:Uncharacterized protein n=1 Tax=Violaceomyces palustris TaxID=1673888 RepID=A0ACD0NPE1_9BASI|nr:hypothetical protein IE53DRAFT_233752 [Violaceomyces palustris]
MQSDAVNPTLFFLLAVFAMLVRLWIRSKTSPRLTDADIWQARTRGEGSNEDNTWIDPDEVQSTSRVSTPGLLNFSCSESSPASPVQPSSHLPPANFRPF